MKRTFSIIFMLGSLGLSSFTKDAKDYEQLAFDYFVSDILRSDFKEIGSLEFKGVTEESYSALGEYKPCLKPADKLGSILKQTTKGVRRAASKVNYENTKDLKIVDFQSEARAARLFVYPSVHVADNYYVFISLQKVNGTPIKYIVELRSDGNISRSCKMD